MQSANRDYGRRIGEVLDVFGVYTVDSSCRQMEFGESGTAESKALRILTSAAMYPVGSST